MRNNDVTHAEHWRTACEIPMRNTVCGNGGFPHPAQLCYLRASYANVRMRKNIRVVCEHRMRMFGMREKIMFRMRNVLCRM